MKVQTRVTPKSFSAIGLLILFLALGGSLWAQNAEQAELPMSFRDISLGMGIDALKSALQQDGLFQFRGDRDVSFLPSREENLIETAGYSFMRRAFFQLKDDRLFMMAYTLDVNLIDHYSVFTTLVNKYGEPQRINPREAVWESDAIRLSIERPLTVKYIDLNVFNTLLEESQQSAANELYLREEFLNGF